MRRAKRRRRRGGQTGEMFRPTFLLRLRPIGLAIRATPLRGEEFQNTNFKPNWISRLCVLVVVILPPASL